MKPREILLVWKLTDERYFDINEVDYRIILYYLYKNKFIIRNDNRSWHTQRIFTVIKPCLLINTRDPFVDNRSENEKNANILILKADERFTHSYIRQFAKRKR